MREYLEAMYRIVCDRVRQQGGEAGTIGIGELPYGESQVMYLAGDIAELERDTGYAALILFEEGIRRLLDQMI